MIAVIRAAEAINPLPFTRNGHSKHAPMSVCGDRGNLHHKRMAKIRRKTHTQTYSTIQNVQNVIDRPLRASEKEKTTLEKTETTTQKHDIRTWYLEEYRNQGTKKATQKIMDEVNLKHP
jgi:hypothetical protein